MVNPLSSFDYLLNRPASRVAQGSREAISPDNVIEQAASAKQAISADTAIEQAAVALGGPIMTELRRAPEGKRTAFELVDALNIHVKDLSPVLDVLSDRFHWIEVDRSDPRGDYQITLAPGGRQYLEKMQSKM